MTTRFAGESQPTVNIEDIYGGYNPRSTAADSRLIKAQLAVLRRLGIEPVPWPRLAGSYPGFVFTEPPLQMAAGHLASVTPAAPTRRTSLP